MRRDGSVRAVGDASVKLGMSIRHKDDIRASAMQQQFGRLSGAVVSGYSSLCLTLCRTQRSVRARLVRGVWII